MSKFKIKFKLQALELEVEGSREDLPHLARALGEQVTGLINPAVAIATGEDSVATERIIEGEVVDVTKKKRRKTTKTASGSSAAPSDSAISWHHDPQKWSSPSQAWKTPEKAIWLLYVVSKETEHSELSHIQIAATFNKHFKQAKTIQAGNVSRDLGNRKAGKDALVGENANKTPSTWFLTDAGRKLAEQLVAGKPE